MNDTVSIAVPSSWLELALPRDNKFCQAAWAVARWHYFQKQNGVCACCATSVSDLWMLDHDHRTQRLRAVVCRSCNVNLGKIDNEHQCVEDWPAERRAMFAAYLERYGK